jgi:hypothetical protein
MMAKGPLTPEQQKSYDGQTIYEKQSGNSRLSCTPSLFWGTRRKDGRHCCCNYPNVNSDLYPPSLATDSRVITGWPLLTER